MWRFLLVLLPIAAAAQDRIIFTSADHDNEEVHAAVIDSNGENRKRLGEGRTFLPVWFGDRILYNNDVFIIMSDSEGRSSKKLTEGFRISVSNNHKNFAFYNENGIGISDSSGNLIKQINVPAWDEVLVTWSSGDSLISYYDVDEEKCFIYNLLNDTVHLFGDSVLHPLWKGEQVLFNKRNADDLFDIYLLNSAQDTLKINRNGEMAVVPAWSTRGDKIAYLNLTGLADEVVTSDMIRAQIILYDIQSGSYTVLSEEAGFTNQAFPQLSFDSDDKNIYYTGISASGKGILKKINIQSGEIVNLSSGEYDDRFPVVRTFN